MDFGKTYRIGNFEVVKQSSTLGRNQLKRLRDEAGISKDVQKHLTRGSLPYIRVRAISGIWSVKWIAGTLVFNLLDNTVSATESSSTEALKGLLSRMYALTSIVGDKEMNSDLTKALSGFLSREAERKKGKEVDDGGESGE